MARVGGWIAAKPGTGRTREAAARRARVGAGRPRRIKLSPESTGQAPSERYKPGGGPPGRRTAGRYVGESNQKKAAQCGQTIGRRPYSTAWAARSLFKWQLCLGKGTRLANLVVGLC